MKNVLNMSRVSYTYHTVQRETLALDQIDLTVKKGEFVALVGPSGCGKSTVLSLISGLLTPSGGIIERDGSVAYMLQHDQLFEWRSILENCTLGLEIRHALTPEALQDVEKMLEQYGLGEFKDARPSSLSGGMRQRAALIRTLALSPQLLLLDEPFSALDYYTRLTVSDEISRIIRAQNKSALLVTHDISEAVAMCDRVLVLSARPARVAASVEIGLRGKFPLERRDDPAFGTYFNLVWKELNKHV